MQIKAVQFTASFVWLRSDVTLDHAACDSNAELPEGRVEMEEHGLESLNLEAEKTIQRKKVVERSEEEKGKRKKKR